MGEFGLGIKSVQRGSQAVVGSSTTDVTITAVVMAKAFITNLSWTAGATGSERSIKAAITSTTNLRITHTAGATVEWEIVEFY